MTTNNDKDDITTAKKILRREINQKLKGIAVLSASSKAKILESLRVETLWQKTDLVMGYLFFKNEFPVDFILKAALKEGKRIAVPRIEGKDIVFYEITLPDKQLLVNSWGIREPDPARHPALCIKNYRNPLMLVPGQAFDSNFKRLGKGKGFYDHFFSKNREIPIIKIGVGYKAQLIKAVPVEPHDESLDGLLIDEKKLILASRNQ